jgi:hypothetical protein
MNQTDIIFKENIQIHRNREKHKTFWKTPSEVYNSFPRLHKHKISFCIYRLQKTLPPSLLRHSLAAGLPDSAEAALLAAEALV